MKDVRWGREQGQMYIIRKQVVKVEKIYIVLTHTGTDTLSLCTHTYFGILSVVEEGLKEHVNND